MVSCARIECKYRNDKSGKCHCKNAILSSWSVNTVNMGRKEFLECKSFEYSDKYLELKKKMEDLGILERK